MSKNEKKTPENDSSRQLGSLSSNRIFSCLLKSCVRGRKRIHYCQNGLSMSGK
jgi:hypothetical protein